MKIQINIFGEWYYLARNVLDANGNISTTPHDWAAKSGNLGALHYLSARFSNYQFRLAA